MTGDIKHVVVLAEFPCGICGNLCNRMTEARVVNGLIVSPAERPEGVIECNDCRRKANDAVKAENKKQRAQRTWNRRATGFLKGGKYAKD